MMAADVSMSVRVWDSCGEGLSVQLRKRARRPL
jgi:hypothetical protein